MPTFSYQVLKERFKGQPCYIVCKGPSLRYLSSDYFRIYGPIIVLNDAIVQVEKFASDLRNPIYSLQKDGDPNFMVRPNIKCALILQDDKNYSRDFFPDFRLRILVDPEKDQGFDHPEAMATRMAISAALYMGCSFLYMLCCDSLALNDYRTFNPKTKETQETIAAEFYKLSKDYILEDLKNINHQFIVPKEIYHVEN